MGSVEEDDGAEEAQEDSSPIELDWASLMAARRTQNHKHDRDLCQVPSSPPQKWGINTIFAFSEGVLFLKTSTVMYKVE